MAVVTVETAGETTTATYTVGASIGALPRTYRDLAEAKRILGLPDANYVMWTPADGDDIDVWMDRLPSDAVGVTPNTKTTLYYSVSNGFMAASVIDMEYLSDADFAANGYTTKIVSGWTPVVSHNKRWFSMIRLPRGLVSLAPLSIKPKPGTSYKGQRQPKSSMGVHYSTDPQIPKRVFLHVGSQQKILEVAHASPILANFTLDEVDFGTIAHSGIAAGKSGGTTFIRDVTLNKCWSGFAGIPNGEAGGIAIGGKYDIDRVTFITDEATSSSPIMWNRAEGPSDIANTVIGKHRIGMITHWKSGGVHRFSNVVTNCGTVGINLEEEQPGFQLLWTGGAIHAASAANTKHVNLIVKSDAPQASIKVTFTNVTVTGESGYAPGKIAVHRTGPANTQKKSDITSDTKPIAYVNTGWLT